jgi:hypothetical protein
MLELTRVSAGMSLRRLDGTGALIRDAPLFGVGVPGAGTRPQESGTMRAADTENDGDARRPVEQGSHVG